MTNLERHNQDGLEWMEELWFKKPAWTREPDVEVVERIARQHLQIAEAESCAVQFLASGAFNKLYRINSERGSHLLRVSLPVDPQRKTQSEVATIQLVKEKTNIPFPLVTAFR